MKPKIALNAPCETGRSEWPETAIISFAHGAIFVPRAGGAEIGGGVEDTAMRAQEREVLTPEEVADYLGCGRTTVFRLLAGGELPSLQIGRLRRVRRADVDEYVERRVGTGGRR